MDVCGRVLGRQARQVVGSFAEGGDQAPKGNGAMFRRRILFGAVVAGLAASLAGCAPVDYAGYGGPVV